MNAASAFSFAVPPASEDSMKRLLLSIHDVSPRFEREVDLLIERLGRHVPLDRTAMLVVPNHWGDAPIEAGTAFAARLRQWSGAGVSMFAHGWFHKDAATHGNAMSRFKARRMTAGEGEFLGLEERVATQRMVAARDLIEQITGRPVLGFVAPAWLYGSAALAALKTSGFTMAEDHMRIWHPATGTRLARGPVLTWASRSPTRIASSLLCARILPPILRHFPVARVAVHPGDVREPAILSSIDNALLSLKRTHLPSRYDDLLPDRMLK